MGFEPLMGSEFEFYLLAAATGEPLFSGYHIFNTVRNDWVPTIRRVMEEMPQIGVDIITSNCEYAGSQWEINFAPGRGLKGPDEPGWDTFEASLLRAADELRADSVISDPTWAALAERYGERQLIEVCMLVGQYHLVAFTLNSLGIEREPGVEGLPG